MTTTNVCKHRAAMAFTAATELYQLSGAADLMDLIDQIHARQSHLEALLIGATMDGDMLGSMSESVRGDYLSACLSASLEIGELTQTLGDRAREALR